MHDEGWRTILFRPAVVLLAGGLLLATGGCVGREGITAGIYEGARVNRQLDDRPSLLETPAYPRYQDTRRERLGGK